MQQRRRNVLRREHRRTVWWRRFVLMCMCGHIVCRAWWRIGVHCCGRINIRLRRHVLAGRALALHEIVATALVQAKADAAACSPGAALGRGQLALHGCVRCEAIGLGFWRSLCATRDSARYMARTGD